MTPHILIADANRSAAQVTRGIVSRALVGASVTVVHTLEGACEDIQRQRPDVLILDPAPDPQAADRLMQYVKLTYPDTRMMVLASAPTPPLRRKMEALGADVYLEKPTLLQQLVQTLQTLYPPHYSPS